MEEIKVGSCPRISCLSRLQGAGNTLWNILARRLVMTQNQR
jgi:hypothetical protein